MKPLEFLVGYSYRYIERRWTESLLNLWCTDGTSPAAKRTVDAPPGFMRELRCVTFLVTSGEPFNEGIPENFASPVACARLVEVRPPYIEFLVDEGNMFRAAELASPGGP